MKLFFLGCLLEFFDAGDVRGKVQHSGYSSDGQYLFKLLLALRSAFEQHEVFVVSDVDRPFHHEDYSVELLFLASYY